MHLQHKSVICLICLFLIDGAYVEPLLSVVIIWRRDTSHIKYEWLSDKWDVEERLNDTAEKLENTIGRLLRSSEALSYEAFVKV